MSCTKQELLDSEQGLIKRREGYLKKMTAARSEGRKAHWGILLEQCELTLANCRREIADRKIKS